MAIHVSPSPSLLLHNPFISSTQIMDAIRATSMVKIELEAAEALAGLANMSSDSVKDESNSSFNAFSKCSTDSYENLAVAVNKQDATNFMLKKSEKSTTKSVQSTALGLNPTYPTNCASSGRKSRQNLTEAELEARKIRRVLANRESARQTIRRRQAIFEELTRKAVDLAWENENLKREKDTASKKYDSLKTKNECLKAQMVKVMNVEEETREESYTTNEPTVSASSTNSPFIICNQPPFLPFVWPSVNSVQLQCGAPAGIVFPVNKPPDCEEGNSVMVNGAGGPLYLVPYPWLVSLPQSGNEQHQRPRPRPRPRPHSFNLNDKPKESSECQQLFPENEKVKGESSNDSHTGFPPDGGGQAAAAAFVSCIESHDDTNTSLLTVTEHVKGTTVGDSEQIPVVCSGKRLGDMHAAAAAAEARKRRKQLTRLKNHFQCRLRMH